MKKTNGEKLRFSAEDVLSLGVELTIYNDFGKPLDTIWEYYDCRPSPKKGIMVFMYKYEEGRIKVYHNPRSSGNKIDRTSSTRIKGISFSYSIDDGLWFGPAYKTTRFIKIWYSSYYIEKDDGGLLKVDKKNYEELWPSLFDDCPKVLEEVKLNPDLRKFNNFLLIVRLYNELCK